MAAGAGFLLVNLLVGKLLRPDRPNAEKLAVYECGEPTIGSSYVQFDLRFYVVALLFVVFDVEVAFFFPWAAVFGKANQIADARLSESGRAAVTAELLGPEAAGAGAVSAASGGQLARFAMVDLLIFFGVLLVGFAYVWKRGDIDWVRAVQQARRDEATVSAFAEPPPAVQTTSAG
jgi:NADH-quinone oxidoreductase subunit A